MICPLCQENLIEVTYGVISQWECRTGYELDYKGHYIIELRDGKLFIESISIPPFLITTNSKYSTIEKEIGPPIPEDGKSIRIYEHILLCPPLKAGPDLLKKIKTLITFS